MPTETRLGRLLPSTFRSCIETDCHGFARVTFHWWTGRLAAQDTLSSLFGAVALFADKPFRVGDRIQLDSIDGSVEAIGLRSTRVRNLDGHLVTVPNRTMANASITNVSKRPNIKTVMNVGVIVSGAFLIAFGSLALCFVFAFGLGSKRAVEMMWEERFRRRKEEREREEEKAKGK